MKDASFGDEPIKRTQQRQIHFFKCLCNWIFDAGLPFSTVENSFFKDMLACLDANLKVSCHTMVNREVSEGPKTGEIKIRDTLSHILCMVSLTTYAWSSRLYRGYLSITMLWVHKDWCLRNVLLDFVRFPYLITVKLPQHCCVSCCQTEVFLEVWRRSHQITRPNCALYTVVEIYVWCIAHVFTLSFKDFLGDVHKHFNRIRCLLSAMPSSAKRLDLCETTQRHLIITVALPSLNTKTRWSSSSKVNDLWPFAISNDVWEKSWTICKLLELAASLT